MYHYTMQNLIHAVDFVLDQNFVDYSKTMELTLTQTLNPNPKP